MVEVTISDGTFTTIRCYSVIEFVLMNENEYLNLKDEVLSLQRNLISMLEVRSGKSETSLNSEEFSEIFDNISAKVKKKHKVKKAAGE